MPGDNVKAKIEQLLDKYGLKIGKDKDQVDQFYKSVDSTPEIEENIVQMSETEIQPDNTKVKVQLTDSEQKNV